MKSAVKKKLKGIIKRAKQKRKNCCEMEKRTEAIVLRTADFSEADRMLTLLSPEWGRFSALARGVRKYGAKLRFAAEPLACCQYIFAFTNSRYILTQALSPQPYPRFREDIIAYSAGIMLGQLAGMLANEQEAAPDLYALLRETLAELQQTEAPVTSAAAGAMRLLSAAGFAPALYRCVGCGASLPDASFFSVPEGGACCENCREANRAERMPVWLLAWLKNLPQNAVRKENEQPLRLEQEKTMLSFVARYAGQRLEGPLPAIAYLQRLL